MGPLSSGVGLHGRRRPGCEGGGLRSRVEGMDVNRLMLLSGRSHVWRSQRDGGDWRPSVIFTKEHVQIRSVSPQRVIRDHEVVLYKSKLKQPLLNDLAPGIRGVNKVPQVVIGYNDPICFFC